jgi:hypothetical protein
VVGSVDGKVENGRMKIEELCWCEIRFCGKVRVVEIGGVFKELVWCSEVIREIMMISVNIVEIR